MKLIVDEGKGRRDVLYVEDEEMTLTQQQRQGYEKIRQCCCVEQNDAQLFHEKISVNKTAEDASPASGLHRR
jgi:hypothetical protein